jgi:hypothetical protein
MDCGDGSSRDVCDQFFIEVMAMKMTDLRFIIGLFFTVFGLFMLTLSVLSTQNTD